jgi:Acetyltransferase (GNAT) domain
MTASGGTELPETAWERASVPLRFQVGDIVLGQAILSLYRRSAQLDEEPLDIDDAPEPPPRLDRADGYVVWSQPIATRLPILRRRRDAIRYIPRQYQRFSVQLSGGFEQYMSTFSGKTRSNLKRKLRKFTEVSGGLIDWKEYRTPEQIATFFPLARKVSSRTYQERLLDRGLPADKVFFISAQTLARDNKLRAYLLFLNGEPVSYLYCPVRQRVVVYDRLGYDPSYASLSPGTVLQILALKALFAEQRFTTFDFTEGEGQHKEIFATDRRLCGDVYVVRERLVPMLLIVLHLGLDRASAGAGSVLEMLKLKSRVRKLIRSVR